MRLSDCRAVPSECAARRRVRACGRRCGCGADAQPEDDRAFKPQINARSSHVTRSAMPVGDRLYSLGLQQLTRRQTLEVRPPPAAAVLWRVADGSARRARSRSARSRLRRCMARPCRRAGARTSHSPHRANWD
jgi:hypothetical protein